MRLMVGRVNILVKVYVYEMLSWNSKDRNKPFHPSNLGSSILYSISNVIIFWQLGCCQLERIYNLSAKLNYTRAKRRRQRIISHGIFVEVKAQESDSLSFQGTGGSMNTVTEQRITYYDTIGTWKRKITNCVLLIIWN